MKKKLVSIIIRTHNEEKWISSCLNAVFEQDYKNFEIIIVDNESVDNTIKIVKTYYIKKILKIKKYFPGKALNLGINNAKGSIIVCLSGHCIPKNSKWLSYLVNGLKSSKIAGVYGKQEPLSFSSPIDKRDLLLTFGLDKKVQTKDSFFHNASSAIKKDLWKKFKFDEKVTNIEDRIWGNRVIKDGYKLIYEPKSVVFHYHGIHHNLNKERAQNIINIIENIEKVKEIDFKKPLNKQKICCIIPAKGEPIKYKNNYLIEHTFKSVKECEFIDQIFLSTDSKITKKIGNEYGISIPFTRPDYLSKDFIDLNSVVKFTLDKVSRKLEYDLVIIVDETYPMRPKNIITNILKSMIKNKNDSGIAIKKETRNIWLENNKQIEEFNLFMPSNLRDSFGLISLFGLCCISTPHLIREGRIIGNKPNFYEVKNALSTNQIKNNAEYKKIFSLIH